MATFQWGNAGDTIIDKNTTPKKQATPAVSMPQSTPASTGTSTVITPEAARAKKPDINTLDPNKVKSIIEKYGAQQTYNALKQTYGQDAVISYFQGIGKWAGINTKTVTTDVDAKGNPTTGTTAQLPARRSAATAATTATPSVSATKPMSSSVTSMTTVKSNALPSSYVENLKTWMPKLTEKFGNEQKAKDFLKKEYEKRGYSFDDAYSAAFGTQSTETPTDVIGWATPWDSQIKGVNSLIDYLNNRRDEYTKFVGDQRDATKEVVDELKMYNAEAGEALDQNIAKRIDTAESTFTAVMDTINKLNAQAEALFDMKVVESTKQRARNLADEGILTPEQSAQAAGFILSDYTAKANLAKSEILLKSQENIADAIKERQSSLDAIYAQEGLNTQQKQQMAEKVSAMYQGIIAQYTNVIKDVNVAIDNSITEAYGKQVEIDLKSELPLIEAEVNTKLSDIERQKVNTNEQDRMDYIFKTLNERVPSLTPYAVQAIEQIYNSGNFMNIDIAKLIADVSARAYALFDSEKKWASSGGGSSSSWWSYSAPAKSNAQNTATSPTPATAPTAPTGSVASPEELAKQIANTAIGNSSQKDPNNPSGFGGLIGKALDAIGVSYLFDQKNVPIPGK